MRPNLIVLVTATLPTTQPACDPNERSANVLEVKLERGKRGPDVEVEA